MKPTVLAVSQPKDAGVAHVVGDHVGWLVDAGWACVVACDPESRVAQLTWQGGGRVAAWPASRNPAKGLVGETRLMRQILADTRPDVVHLHSSKAGLVGRLAVRGRRPTLFQPHAWSFEAATGLAGRLAVNWEVFAQRWTDATICVSRAEREQGATAGVSGRMVVLPNSVDAQRFQPIDTNVQTRDALRSSLGVSGERPLVVCLGRLCRQKGQDLLLSAWSRVTTALPEADLALVGDGPDRDALMASNTEAVRFAGSVADPVPWLQAADVVVVPSRWEGQPLVVLEAMACGIAVVASNIPPNVETLPPSAGALVPAADPQQLAQALLDRLVPHGRARAVAEGAAGRRHVMLNHDPSLAAEGLIDLYRETLTRAPRRSNGGTLR